MGEEMKNLSAAIRILIAFLFSVTIVGCGGGGGGGEDGQKVRDYSGDPRTFRGEVEIPELYGVYEKTNPWGEVFDYDNHNFNEPPFQKRVEDFLFPILNSDQIGEMDANSGIFFYGRNIRFSSQPSFDRNSGEYTKKENVFDTGSSELRIEIEDNYNGQSSFIPLHFNVSGKKGTGGLTKSAVEKNVIQLVFEDQFGKIYFYGEIYQENDGSILYAGNVFYKNLAYLREGRKLESLNEDRKFLGGFRIIACRFFDVSEISGYKCSN